ncbi:MAG: type II secretion system protein J [Gammaproteobacteria bacterium]
MKHNTQRRAGFGLLDILLALAVSAIIVVLAVRYYTNTQIAQKTNQTMDQLTQIRQAVATQIQNNSANSKSTSNNITITTLINSQLIEPSTAISAWDKSQITISTSTSSTCLSLNVTICGIAKGAEWNAVSGKFTATFAGENPSVGQGSNNCMLMITCLE